MNTRMAVLGLALAATGLLIASSPGFAQTPGMQRRDDVRATRQTGRHAGRDVKQACRDAGGNPMECRHQKQATKQRAREEGRDIRTNR
jgi:hypothetical protein